jgi:photosystem II stability/assembly factor-like uncharacterized protein
MARKGWMDNARVVGSWLAVAGVCTALAIQALPAGATTPVWTQRSIAAASDFPLRSVACTGTGCVAMAEECSASGCGGLLPGKAFSSPNAGVSWKAGTFPSNLPLGIACGSAAFCVDGGIKGPLGPGVSEQLLVTHNAGASWASHTESTMSSLNADLCASATSCMVFGSIKGGSSFTNELLRTTNGGASWAMSKFPDHKGTIEGAACAAPNDCVAVGSNATNTGAVIFLSTNQGASWKQETVPSAAKALFGVTCTGLVCIAIAPSKGQVLISKNGGTSWALHTFSLTPSGPQYQAAACLTGTECVLVGSLSSTGNPTVPVAALTKNGGASWATQSLPHVDGTLSAVVCPNATGCVAVGARLTYSGSNATGEYPLVITY